MLWRNKYLCFTNNLTTNLLFPNASARGESIKDVLGGGTEVSQKEGGGKQKPSGRLSKLVAEGKLELSNSSTTDFFSRGMLRLTLLLLPVPAGLIGGVEDAIGGSLRLWLSQ